MALQTAVFRFSPSAVLDTTGGTGMTAQLAIQMAGHTPGLDETNVKHMETTVVRGEMIVTILYQV
jgi:hypothetical protein